MLGMPIGFVLQADQSHHAPAALVVGLLGSKLPFLHAQLSAVEHWMKADLVDPDMLGDVPDGMHSGSVLSLLEGA